MIILIITYTTIIHLLIMLYGLNILRLLNAFSTGFQTEMMMMIIIIILIKIRFADKSVVVK